MRKDLIFNSENENDFIESVFEKSRLYEGNQKYYENRIILSVLNKSVEELNNIILNYFKSKKEKTYYSHRKLNEDCQHLSIDSDILNNLELSGLPPHKLRLKTGCIVMLIRNIDCKVGMCNGTRIVVTDLLENLIVGRILLGKFKNNVVMIPRIILASDEKFPIKFKVKQFPVRPAFVLTINKSQGQTFEHVGIHLKDQVFSHGQLYVALSRCSRPQNIKVFLGDQELCVNEVYREVLSDL